MLTLQKKSCKEKSGKRDTRKIVKAARVASLSIGVL
jgi:hypothetical protein